MGSHDAGSGIWSIRVAAQCFTVLLFVAVWACGSAQPQASGVAAMTALHARDIYTTACRPERCYRELGQVKYVEGVPEAENDLSHIGATEQLKTLAVEKYGGQADTIISLRAVKDPRVAGVIVSGEAVQFDQRATLSCIVQRFGSAAINLACDSQREGMIGDADEYERIYESLP